MNEETKVCENILFYRQKQGITQKALAAKLDISFKTLSSWEVGRNRPDIGYVPDICKALGITPNLLFDRNAGIRHEQSHASGSSNMDDDLTDAEREHLKAFRRLNAQQQLYISRMTEEMYDVFEGTLPEVTGVEPEKAPPRLVLLQYFERGLAAGVDFFTEQEQTAEPVYVYASPEAERADFVFPVSGNSMEPVYHNGDHVLVRKQTGLRYGEIGAFMINGEQYIKQYEKDGLHSLNRRYRTIKPSEDIQVIGLVVGTLDAKDFASVEDVRKFKADRD